MRTLPTGTSLRAPPVLTSVAIIATAITLRPLDAARYAPKIAKSARPVGIRYEEGLGYRGHLRRSSSRP
ncbi:MAG: hypothetical protein RXN88_00550 [Acidilobus sp.]